MCIFERIDFESFLWIERKVATLRMIKIVC
jgi:hypothetical protein